MAVIFGINPVLEQLHADPGKVHHLFLARGSLRGQLARVAGLAREKGVAVTFVERKVLDRKAGGAAHQGAVADTGEYDYASLVGMLDGMNKPARIIVLDGVQDPQNLGAIVRTVVCAGADGVVIPQRGAAAMTGIAVKASAGAAAHARVARVTNIVNALAAARDRGVWSVAVDALGKQEIGALDPTLDYALVFGGEGQGIRRLVRERCDFTARIPMPGPLDSLNVSVAVGVALYSLLHRREKQ